MKTNDFIIRPEKKEDYFETENLTREAFWNVYCPGCTEHFVLHKFRDDKDFVPELDFVMEKDNKIIGHIMYAKAKIQTGGKSAVPVLTFGPLSILPRFQRLGYGKALLDFSLNEAEKTGLCAVAITGNINFYGKSGFVLASSKGIRCAEAAPGDSIVPYFLIRELKKDSLKGITGTFKTPEGYYVCEKFPEEFQKYEAQFPNKEKLRLPGQLS